MGAFDFLLGGSEQSSSQKSSSQTVDVTPPEIAALRSPFADVLAGLLDYQRTGPLPAPRFTPKPGDVPSSGNNFFGTGVPPAAAGAPGGGGNRLLLPEDGQAYIDAQRSGAPGYRMVGGPNNDQFIMAYYGQGGGGGSGGTLPGGAGVVQSPTYTRTGGGDPLSGIPQYGGPLVAGLTPNEQAILNALMQSQATSGAGRSGYLDSVIGGKFLPGAEGSNPFLQAAIEAAQRPTFQALEETLSRTLPGRFTQAGQFTQPQGSSAFDRAAAMAARDSQQTAADIATNLSFGAYESERGRQQEAITLSQNEVETTLKNLQAQALPRLIQDLGVERGLQQFRERTQTLLQVLSIITGAPLTTTGTEAESTGTASGESTGGLLPGLSGLFGGGKVS